MKIVLWIGNEANQKALANKMHAQFPLAGIVRESKKHKRNITFKLLFEKLIEKIFLSSIGKSWYGMKSHYDSMYFGYPDTHILDVENINCQSAYDFTKEIAPDLILVSGTRLIKAQMLGLKPSVGILNLHTGLSPYIKGGPNCTNWCISTAQFHLIGNTIMWIDGGIDSGNIVRTDFTSFDGTENLFQLHLKVMEHAHYLYLRAIDDVVHNNFSNVKQSDIVVGQLYYNKSWGLKEKIAMVKNLPAWKRKIKNGEILKKQQSVRIVKGRN